MSGMIQFNTGPMLQSLGRINGGFVPAMNRAADRLFNEFMEGVVGRTPKPGDEENVRYIRTGRLLSGWKPAAEAVGVNVTSPRRITEDTREGVYVSVSTPPVIERAGQNHVEYAQEVEFPGPHTKQPYYMVEVPRDDLANRDVWHEVVEAEWKTL